MGAEEPYLEMALSYIDWLIYGCATFIINLTANAGLNAQGDTKTYRNALIFGFLVNIGLDPLLMFGRGTIPQFGSGRDFDCHHPDSVGYCTLYNHKGSTIFLGTAIEI